MQSCYPSQLRINYFYLRGTSRGKGQCRTACPRRHPWRKALLCLLSLISVFLCDLRATSAPCPEAGRAQSLHHPSDVFRHLVRLFGEVGRLSLLLQLPTVHLCKGQAQFWGGKKPWKAMSVGRERDWISTCLPDPDSAPFPVQGHQMGTSKSKKHPLVFTPFSYLSYIQRRYHTPSRRIVL